MLNFLIIFSFLEQLHKDHIQINNKISELNSHIIDVNQQLTQFELVK